MEHIALRFLASVPCTLGGFLAVATITLLLGGKASSP